MSSDAARRKAELIATSRDLALVSYLFCAHEAIHTQTAAERESGPWLP